jgi:uncharacterized protein (DUF362 family)
MNRRRFLRNAALAGAGALVAPHVGLHAASTPFGAGAANARYLALHPFIEEHPDAVFVMRTGAAAKVDAEGKRAAGAMFASRVFRASQTDGIPFTHALAVKPNLTCSFGTAGTADGMGIRTDVAFTEGVLASLIGLGYPSESIWMREGNWAADGYCADERLVGESVAMAERLGIHLLDFASGRSIADLRFDTLVEGTEVVWKDVPGGVVFKRLGYLAPFNSADSWTLNIAKMKSHSMGLTLAVKNLQGTVVSPLVRFCEGIDATAGHAASVRAHFHDDLEARIAPLYERHLRDGYVRWDRPGRDWTGGFGMETWAQRTCDSHSVMTGGLHIVEAIYSRNGNGFTRGPGAGDTPQEFLSNMLIFGRDAFLVDLVAFWIGGQEPGNFGHFHCAAERGLLDRLDPRTVPVYRWDDAGPELVRLESIERVPLLNPYLRRDYDGGDEPEFHLVDEPYDYGTSSAPADVAPPALRVIGGFGGAAVIEYTLPRGGPARVEVFDAHGARVAIAAEGYRDAGAHVVDWSTMNAPAGAYLCRLSFAGRVTTAKLVVTR